jgi:hypothetical protein
VINTRGRNDGVVVGHRRARLRDLIYVVNDRGLFNEPGGQYPSDTTVVCVLTRSKRVVDKPGPGHPARPTRPRAVARHGGARLRACANPERRHHRHHHGAAGREEIWAYLIVHQAISALTARASTAADSSRTGSPSPGPCA